MDVTVTTGGISELPLTVNLFKSTLADLAVGIDLNSDCENYNDYKKLIIEKKNGQESQGRPSSKELALQALNGGIGGVEAQEVGQAEGKLASDNSTANSDCLSLV